ncbi:hypothetical protein [Brevibacillus laterosporus]|uniref:hypothetical protein n=1 Tax=Brevibacillus laterosporus TaxID=1465 RepID=UPI003D1D547B
MYIPQKRKLEKQLGVKLFRLTDIAKKVGVSHQRISKIYNAGIKGAKTKVKNPIPKPVIIEGRSAFWSEQQVRSYIKTYKHRNFFQWIVLENGEKQLGKVCKTCGKFVEKSGYNRGSYSNCRKCYNFLEAMKARKLNPYMSPYKPLEIPFYIPKYNENGERTCRDCGNYKPVSDYHHGNNVKIQRPICRDCYNLRRRKYYAKHKGEGRS